MTQNWNPTREDALRRLEAFVPDAAQNYTAMRNFDLGPDRHDHVSVLSPWIRHRLITEQEVVQRVLESHSLKAAEKFVQEVFWRTYWKGWLELRPAVWDEYVADRDRQIAALDNDSDLNQRWLAACRGETSIDCFNAWARELVETGYMHNHARMWFASIWIFTLKLPWEVGADFFLRNLLDGDPASNTLSWRWVAGLQTRGKTYTAGAGNIVKFTKGRFQPKPNDLADYAEPLDGPELPRPLSPPTSQAPEDVPTGTLVTEEDLSATPTGPIAYIKATDQRSTLPISDHVHTFVDGAFDDTSNRIGSMTMVTAETIIDWAQQNELKQVVTSYVPVGPTRPVADALRIRLEAAGIRYTELLRPWDENAWPYATKGFFPFKKKIPKLVDQLVDL
ncbi:MAG: FAD-binding domain-containing protein [Planctomycetaceae bacterium]